MPPSSIRSPPTSQSNDPQGGLTAVQVADGGAVEEGVLFEHDSDILVVSFRDGRRGSQLDRKCRVGMERIVTGT